MNHTEENMTPQQSLDLITSMINQAKGNVKKNSFYFLLWGWTIMICNVSVFVLVEYFSVTQPFWIFLLTIPAAVVSTIYGKRQEEKGTPTHLDNINKWLWICFGIVSFTIVAFGSKINYQINGVIICMSAVPTFISGIMLRFRPLVIGGICFWIGSIIIFMIPNVSQFLVAGLAIGAGYLIPGYLLRTKSE